VASVRPSRLGRTGIRLILDFVHENSSVHVNVNRAINVNIDALPPREGERLFADKLRELIAEVIPKKEVLVDTHFTEGEGDFVASVRLPSGPQLKFFVECKLHPRPSMVPDSPGGVAHQDLPAVAVRKEFNPDDSVKTAHAWIYAAPFVSPRLAEVCWDRGWSWYDLAGNCRISVPGLLYLDRKGNPPVHQTSRREVNLGTPEAGRILRTLLNPPRGVMRWASQRELQAEIAPAVSLGLVNKVITHLRLEGHVAEENKSGLQVVDPEKLLVAWRSDYRFDRLSRWEWFTLLKAGEIDGVMRDVNFDNPPNVAWSVFSAAEREAPMVRQPKFWLMAVDESLEDLRERLKAVPVETGANLTLLMAPDRGYLAGTPDDDPPRTSALQTYLDTWHAGGRGQEAAQAILEQRLRPAWQKMSTP